MMRRAASRGSAFGPLTGATRSPIVDHAMDAVEPGNERLQNNKHALNAPVMT